MVKYTQKSKLMHPLQSINLKRCCEPKIDYQTVFIGIIIEWFNGVSDLVIYHTTRLKLKSFQAKLLGKFSIYNRVSHVNKF